jgi:hypothetical protein
LANVVATPQQLAAMAQVLNAYCLAFSVRDSEERDQIGLLLLQFLERGKTSADELSAALDEHILAGSHR